MVTVLDAVTSVPQYNNPEYNPEGGCNKMRSLVSRPVIVTLTEPLVVAVIL